MTSVCVVCVCAPWNFGLEDFLRSWSGRAGDSHGVSRGTWSRITFPRKRQQRERRRKVSLEENRSQAPRSRAEKRSSCQKLFSLEEEGQKVFGAKSGSPLPRVWSHGVLFREENRFRVPCGKCQITDLRGGLCSEQRKSNKARKKIKEFVLVLRGEKKV